jgi:hypothetical protein
MHDPRKARPKGSQFHRIGLIAEPIRLPASLRQLASAERAAADRSGDPWLVLNLQLFNFAAGWNQLLAREQAQQFTR